MEAVKPFEIYIHIPFCVRKCRYCDFLSGPAKAGERAAYVDALCNELRETSKKCMGRQVSSVFLGGGTPSTLETGEFLKIFGTLKECYDISPDAEISVECNPGTLNREKLLTMKNAGVNRLSIGLQSALKEELEVLGRIHDFEEFKSNYELARELGFNNINIDLMQSLPLQTKEKAAESLEKVLELKPEHISVYSLIIEEGTLFYECYGGRPELLPDEDTEREIYRETEKRLAAAEFVHYEISNYSLKGYECRHNCGYWTGVDYLGFGTGAASLYENQRFNNTRDIRAYIEANGICPDKESFCELTKDDRMSEFMFLGLRMLKGISPAEFKDRFGKSIEEVYGKEIKKHLQLGTLEEVDGRIRLTKYGLDVSNSVMCEFV